MPMSLRPGPALISRKTLSSFGQSPDALALALIAAFLVFRLILAATLGFSVDESYTIANARELSLSYFDHPPLHYWIAHAFIPVLGEGHALRLPFVALFAGSTWLLYLLTRALFGGFAGVWAILALNLSAFFTVSAGSWIVPDGPLIFCLLAAALTVAKAFFPQGTAPSPWRTWPLTGLWLGLAALSKYHAVLFGLSLFLYLVSMPQRRRVLLHPAPWIGAAIALLLFAPVVIWNAEHHWVSFAYQGRHGFVHVVERGGEPSAFHPGNVLIDAGGQVAWLFPWIFVPLIIAAFKALRAGRGRERSWYCLCLGVPTIAFFTITPLWGHQGLPHWPMPGWLMLYPILGDYLAHASAQGWPRRWAIGSATLLAALAVVVVGHAATGFGKFAFAQAFRHGDPTLETLEWTPLARELAARGYLDRKDIFIVAPYWLDAGRIDQALGGALPVVAFGDWNEPKHFDLRYDRHAFLGRDALIIGIKIDPDIEARLRPYFATIEELPPVVFGRSRMPEIKLRVLYGNTLLKPFPPFYVPDTNAGSGRSGEAVAAPAR
jgi:4-amino-4-deoxy-L-arabinose transferase-like glycosyltransferase